MKHSPNLAAKATTDNVGSGEEMRRGALRVNRLGGVYTEAQPWFPDAGSDLPYFRNKQQRLDKIAGAPLSPGSA